jgi:hypothetical protein
MISLAETSNAKLGLTGIGGEARIGRLIFKTVSSAAHAETVRIEDELCRQLDSILTDTGSSQEEAVTPLSDERIRGDASLRVKNAIKQPFVYLERIMVLDISQVLCK